MPAHETGSGAHDAAYERWLRANVPRFSRRTLLKGAGALAAASALPAGVGCGGSNEKVAMGLGDDRALFERLVEVVLPVQPGSAFAKPKDLPVLEHVDAMLERVDPELRSDLSKGFGLFNWSAVLLGLNFRTFLSLDDEAALAHCRRWEQGNTTQRGLMNAMKSMVLLSYWREPATWPAVRFAGPVSMNTPRLGNAPLPPEDQPPAPAPTAENAVVAQPAPEASDAR